MNLAFRFTRRAACAGLFALALPAAFAWTDKPVKVIVPAPAGGVMDQVARIIGEALRDEINLYR